MSSSCVQVFTKDNHTDYLIAHEDSVNSLISNALKNGFPSLASNFVTDEIAVSFGDFSLLGTVNEKEYGNSPICSPFNLFCLYPKKKIKKIKLNWLRHSLNICTSLFSILFKTAKFDRVIQLNNKPCDAIVYPNLSPFEIENCLYELKEKYPSHTIIFPRLDKLTSPDLFEILANKGFLMVPTRIVHIFHPNDDYITRRYTKRDLNLLKKDEFRFVSHEELTDKDLERIFELYRKLFVEKHGTESPKLTLEFFRQSHAHRWYTFFGLRNKEGILDGFFSYETKENIMACGPLGYDTDYNQEIGLYRMIFAQALMIAQQHQYIFNFGGGE